VRQRASAGPRPIHPNHDHALTSGSCLCLVLQERRRSGYQMGLWEFGLWAPRAGVPGDMALGAQNKSADREPVVLLVLERAFWHESQILA